MRTQQINLVQHTNGGEPCGRKNPEQYPQSNAEPFRGLAYDGRGAIRAHRLDVAAPDSDFTRFQREGLTGDPDGWHYIPLLLCMIGQIREPDA